MYAKIVHILCAINCTHSHSVCNIYSLIYLLRLSSTVNSEACFQIEMDTPLSATAAEIEALKVENRALRSALQAQRALLDGALQEAAACREALMRFQQNSRDEHPEMYSGTELRDDVSSLGRPPQLDGTQGSTRNVPLMTPSRLYSRPALGTIDSRHQRFQTFGRTSSGFETPLFSSSASSSATKPSGPVAMPSKPDKLDGPRAHTSSTPSSLVIEALSSSVNESKKSIASSPRYIPVPLHSTTPLYPVVAVSNGKEPPPPKTPSAASMLPLPPTTPSATSTEGLHSSPLNFYLPYNWPSTAEAMVTTKRTVMPINDSVPVAQRSTPNKEQEQEPRPIVLSTRRLGRN